MSQNERLRIKKELEEKKKKLEEYKKARGKKEEETLNKLTNENKSGGLNNLQKISNLDDLLNNLEVVIPNSSINTSLNNNKNSEEIEKKEIIGGNDNEIKTQPTISSQNNILNYLNVQPNVVQIDILPKEIETYHKSTQTNLENEKKEEINDIDLKTVEKKDIDLLSIKKENIIEKEKNNHELEIQKKKELEKKIVDECLSSTDFTSFLTKTSKIIERAILVSSKYDITTDYATVLSQEQQSFSDKQYNLSLDIKLFDDRWSKHRAITSLDWSPKHSDIVVASYSSNETANINDPDGVVLVWSLKDTLQRPEYRFHCQSSVTSCIFSTFSPTLIIGGTYSGQIVLWDIRASSTPIQNTPLSSIGHTHPIFCMTIVGTKNAHNLITISSDGKLCVWAVENLIQPIEVLELYNKQTKTLFTNMPVAVTAMAFPEGEVNKFLIGSEEGAIYLAERHGNINGIYEKLNSHHGPITAIDFHPSHGSIDFSNLFLTSSTDWSCKLWNEKGSRKFIYSFEESNDYIYDIKWCPTHPAIFATADGTGSLDIWNLNQETEVPIIKTNVGGNSKALNKIKWSVDGKKILVGDSIGNLYLYNTGEISIPNQDEWRRFEETLIKLSTVQDDMSSSTNY